MTRVRQALADVPLWFRLVVSMLVIMGVALLATGVTATTALRGYLVGRLDTQLSSYADVAAHDGPPGDRGHGPNDLNAFYVAYLDGTGRALGEPISTSQSPPALPTVTPDLVAQQGSRPFTVAAVDGVGEWRVVLAAAQDGGGYRVVAVSATGVEQTVHRLVAIELTGGIGVLLLVAGGTYLVVRRNLRPLVQVEHTASAIAAGDLTLRVPQRSARNEVGRLSSALNAMLGQIESAFDAQRRSESDARRSEQRMRQFVADASHELRTPLTSIRGFAELNRQGAVAEGPELRRVLRRVEDEAARMGLLVDELLLLARLDQQRPFEQGEVHLAQLARDAVDDANAADRTHPVSLQVAADAVVRGDEARLRQVLANLLANARTHTPAGTAITVGVGVDGTSAFVDVADEGPGMPPEQAERVFERFYRADAARTRATGGSGLGLSIVAALVAAHGGDVTVQTAPGEGARFRVRLPLPGSQRPTASRTATTSPSSSCSALRTHALTGTTYCPSFGHSDVAHRVRPIVASTGIIPQP